MNGIRGISPSGLYDKSRLLGDNSMSPPVFTKQHMACKIGSSTFRFQTKFVTAVALMGIGALLLLYVMVPSSRTTSHHMHSGSNNNLFNSLNILGGNSELPYKSDELNVNQYAGPLKAYDNTYPLTPPIINNRRGTIRYRIAMVTDLDTDSKSLSQQYEWISYFKKGYLELDKSHSKVQLFWGQEPIKLTSKLSYEGRGLELSELITYNGKLYSLDDRTGIVYHIDMETNKAVPWVVLNDGDGNNPKGFKSEWATVKDNLLYVGGLGKEWTSPTGELINFNPQWIKIINSDGHVESKNWTDNYLKLRYSEGITFPGYMIHEAVCWSKTRQQWVFLPRKVSKDRYSEKADEHRGADLMLTANTDFTEFKATHIGPNIDSHGFSSFKFVPGTNENIIVALKSEEVDGKTATYITAFDMQGNILLNETKLDNFKYEGIEFI